MKNLHSFDKLRTGSSSFITSAELSACLHPSLWAIVPVKPLRQSKTRLAHILSVEQRAQLMYTFLEHTLTTLNQSPHIDYTLVVSSDPIVLTAASRHNALTLDEGNAQGLNKAVTQAVCKATMAQATSALILPADLPFVQVGDVEMMVGAKSDGRNGRSRLIICSDDKNEGTHAKGTNALLVDLPTRFTFQYGVGSFNRHLQEAARSGLSTHIVHTPGLQFDLDTEADWRKYKKHVSRIKCQVSRIKCHVT